MHGGGAPVTAGTPLAPEYKEENVALVESGTCNLARHIKNCRQYGVPVVVAINKFASDTPAELEAVRTASMKAGEHLQPEKSARSVFFTMKLPILFDKPNFA